MTYGITTKGPGDLWHEEFNRDAAAFDEFVGLLEADGREWEKRLIDECLAFGRGDLFEAIGADERMEILQISSSYLSVSEIHDMGLAARDSDNQLIVRHAESGLPLYRVDMQDLVTYRQAAVIAQQYGHTVDTTNLDRVIRLVAERACEEWLADDDNVRKLMEVVYG